MDSTSLQQARRAAHYARLTQVGSPMTDADRDYYLGLTGLGASIVAEKEQTRPRPIDRETRELLAMTGPGRARLRDRAEQGG